MEEQPSVKWSATFTATSPSVELKGDKIILPQSALEQLLAATASTSDGSVNRASSSFAAFHQQAPYAQQQQHQQLPNPLMFRLVNATNGNTVHAGIREFSAHENEILLSPYLMEALGIAPDQLASSQNGSEPLDIDTTTVETRPFTGPQITVHAKQLPKGTYVRLRPLEAGYNPDDWKSLLERQLRESFTTLTNGAFLSVRGVKGETFRFLIDQFQPGGDGICVVDTDLEVDIEALNEEQARETMRRILADAQTAPGTSDGSSIGQELNIWKAVDGRVLPGDYVDYELPSWARSRALEIELSELEDEDGVDLYVSPRSSRQRALPRESEYVFGAFVFSEKESGVKRITIPPTNVELDEAEALLISVHAHNDTSSSDSEKLPRRFRLRARNVTAANGNVGSTAATQETVSDRGSEEEQCKNCRQWIPKRTMVLHENFCRRNNIACPDCGNVFQKSSIEWEQHWHCPHDAAHGSSERSKLKHDRMYHSEYQCPGCSFTTNALSDLARHRTTVCPGKIILCRFCHLEVPQEGDPFNPSAESLLSGLSEHELADGARTTDCHLCSKIIRLRDMATHLKHHDLEKAHRLTPTVCRNANCGRTMHGVGKNSVVGTGSGAIQGNPGNDYRLCSLCFSPLYVSLHDPEGKALKRRIERKYLSQMMTGCGKKWCRNEWCKTGRANMSLEARGSSAQAVLPLVKPLTEAFRDTQAPMYFCVDESNQRRRVLAEMLASEQGWALEWCIAACEAESPDLDRAREWLVNWAPMKE